MKKKLIGSALILILLTLCVSCGNKGNKAIKIVKSGTFPSISNQTIDKGAQKFLENPTYSAYEIDDDIICVNLDGYIDLEKMKKRMLNTDVIKYYFEEKDDAEALVDSYLQIFGYEPALTYQILVDTSDKSFSCSNVMFNGEESIDEDIVFFLQLLLQDYETLMKGILQ